jgi:hypothetical protein
MGAAGERYRGRLAAAERERDAHAAHAARISNLRLGAFAAALGALVWARLQPGAATVLHALVALALLAFVVLIVLHARAAERGRRAAELAAVNREALARLARRWDDLPPVPERGPASHPYAHDLDIFGHASLARLLATTGTGIGGARLHAWLLEPTPLGQTRERQEAVRELVPMLDFRQ